MSTSTPNRPGPVTSPARDARALRVGGVAGVAGAGLALGLSELAAGLVPGVPSPVDVVAAQVVPLLPGGLVTWAIETLGTTDRLVIGMVIVVMVAMVGGVAGRQLARGRQVEAGAVFGGFAMVGVLAALGDIGTDLALTAFAILGSTAVGFLVTRFLLHVAGIVTPGHVRAVPTDRPSSDRVGRVEPSAPASREADPLRAPPPDEDPGHLDAGDVVPGRLGRAGASDSSALDRRRFLAAAASVGSVAVAAGAAGRLAGRPPAVDPDAVDVAGALPTPVQTLPTASAAARLDVEGLTPLFVPNDEFYRIDTALAGPPRVDLGTWSLRVHGRVDREQTFTFAQLVDRGLVEADVTIACVSNTVGGGLVGNARWTGIPLGPLLDEVGVQDGATQLVGRSVDGFTAGFPTELARDGRDAMIAVAMNGEPLPVAHGFPARLIVPGLYGYVSATKWLSDLELTGWEDFDAYWIQRTWAKEGPVKTQSRIDTVGNGAPTAGSTTAAGVAWAPTRGIQAVQVRVDQDDWRDAELSQPLGDDTWIQWKVDLDLAAGDHTITVRATDGTGAIQPEPATPEHPDGAEGWHQVRVAVQG